MSLIQNKLTSEHIDPLAVNNISGIKDNCTRAPFSLVLKRMREYIADIPFLIRIKLKKTFCNFTVIGPDTALKGIFNAHYDIHIYGKHEGNIETKYELYIGRDAYVIGEIKCRKAVVRGTLYGNLEAELAEIHTSGIVNGNISAKSLFVQPGGVLLGECRCPNKINVLQSYPITSKRKLL